MQHRIPILLSSILTVLALPFVFRAKPFGACGDENDPLLPSDVVDFTSSDTNRIVGNVARALARKAVYTDVLEGGTIAAHVSETQRSVVQERAFLNESLVRPTFRDDTAMCGAVGEAAEVGATEYTYKLQSLRGMGPLVCVKGMRNAFQGAYEAAENSLAKQIVHLTNSDIRATLVDRSGSKLVVQSGTSFSDMYDGDTQLIDVPFPSVAPTAALNFRLLEYLGQFLREDLMVEGFEGNMNEPLLKFIGSHDIVNKLRDEANVKEDHRYLAAGSYMVGKDTLLRYNWEGPYRGFAFGVDSQPLRYNSLDGNGQPVYIEPEIGKTVSKGRASRINPAWIRAKYEVGLLVGRGSFRRLAPAQFTGEGGFRFPPQTTTGELMFQVIKDNSCNVWGDFGRHYYQLSRAYKPERPHAVCPIAYARQETDFQLTAITSYGDWSSTASI